jgi:hypothetical protein
MWALSTGRKSPFPRSLICSLVDVLAEVSDQAYLTFSYYGVTMNGKRVSRHIPGDLHWNCDPGIFLETYAGTVIQAYSWRLRLEL